MLGGLVLVGCASDPKPPSASLQGAEVAIGRAEDAGAAESAALELRTARENLNAAQAKAHGDDKEDMVEAKRLAEKATADAEVATAKANAAQAEAANQEIQNSIDALREETSRQLGS